MEWIRRRFLESILHVPALCFVVLGVYEEDADANLLSRTKTSPHDVLKKGLADPTALVLPIDG